MSIVQIAPLVAAAAFVIFMLATVMGKRPWGAHDWIAPAILSGAFLA
jgi:hypothetical protein